MHHTTPADSLPITSRDVIVCEFLVRHLCLTIAHHAPTRRELAAVLKNKVESQAHFFTAVEVKLMQAIADVLSGPLT